MPVTFLTKNLVQDPVFRLYNPDGLPLPTYGPVFNDKLTGSPVWYVEVDAATAVLTATPTLMTDADQDSIEVRGAKAFMRWTTSVTSHGDITHGAMYQRIPMAGFLGFGQPVSYKFSAWVRRSATGNVGLRAVLNFGTGGSPSPTRVVAVSTVRATAGQWDRVTLDIRLGDYLAETLGSNMDAYLQVEVYMAEHSDRVPRSVAFLAGETFDITGAQVEAGDVVTAFEEEGPFYSADMSASRMRSYGAPVDSVDVVTLGYLGTAIGATNLGDIGDVNVSGVTDGQSLVYNAGTATWVPGSGSGSGGAERLNDLLDVTVGAAAAGDLLVYDGVGMWNNSREIAQLSINGAPLTYALNVLETTLKTAGEFVNERSATPPENVFGVAGCAYYSGATDATTHMLVGAYGCGFNLGAADVESMAGVLGIAGCESSATGRVDNAYGVYGAVRAASGQILYGYGMYVEASSPAANIVERWGLYQAGASDYNYFAGPTGIGSQTPTSDDLKLLVTYPDSGALVGNVWGAKIGLTTAPGFSTSAIAYGLEASSVRASGNIHSGGWLVGAHALAQNSGSGAVSLALGVQAEALAGSAGASIVDARAVHARVGASNASATVGSAYGVFIEAATTGTVTNLYGVYQTGVSVTNVFEGVLLCGNGSPATSSSVWAFGKHIFNQTSGSQYGFISSTRAEPAATSTASYFSGYFTLNDSGATAPMGAAKMIALYANPGHVVAHPMDRMECLRLVGQNFSGSGQLDSMFGIYSQLWFSNTATPVNYSYHIYLESQNTGATYRYGIYQASPFDQNYFAGHTRLGDAGSPASDTFLDVAYTKSGNTETYAGQSTLYWSASAATAAAVYGFKGKADVNTGNNTGTIYGMMGSAVKDGAGSCGTMYGINAQAVLRNGAATALYSVLGASSTQGGSALTSAGGYFLNTISGGSVVNAYGVLIAGNAVSGTGTVTNSWGLYQAGAADQNYFAGTTVMGEVTTPASGSILTTRAYCANTSGTNFGNVFSGNFRNTAASTGTVGAVYVTGNTSSATGDLSAATFNGLHVNVGHTNTTRPLGTFRNIYSYPIAGYVAGPAAAITTFHGIDQFQDLGGASAGGIGTSYELRLRSYIPTGFVSGDQWAISQENPRSHNYFAGRIGLHDATGITGVNALLWALDLDDNLLSGSKWGANFDIRSTAASASSAVLRGVEAHAIVATGTTAAHSGEFTGGYLSAQNRGTGTLALARGVVGRASTSEGGDITDAVGAWFQVQNLSSGAVITNGYGVFIQNPVTTGTITNKYGVFQQGTGVSNVFEGGISQTSASDAVNVAGVATFTNTTLINAPRGEIYQDDAGNTVTLTTDNVWYPITSAYTDSGNSRDVTVGAATGRLTPTRAGVYLVSWSLSGEVNGSGETLEMGIYKNTAIVNSSQAETHFSNANAIISVSGTALVAMNGTTDYLRLAVNNNTSSGKIYTIDHAMLSIVRVGA